MGKVILGRVCLRGFDDSYRATPRADIWIPRPRRSVCREKRLTRRRLLADIATVFALHRLRALRYPAGRAGSSLNSYTAQLKWSIRTTTLFESLNPSHSSGS